MTSRLHAPAACFLSALLACSLAACVLTACGSSSASAIDDGDASGASYSQPSSVAVPHPSAEGIDISGVGEGWVCASATSASRLKFQVICGDMTYNYDLPNDGTANIFPLNMGNGYYTFRIMQNTEGNNYVMLDGVDADVTMSSEFAPYLIPSQICAYTADSPCVAKARELTAKSENQGQAVASICTYVAKNVTYDKAKAEELATATGYIPNPDDTFSSGKGICFDYASLSGAMLRSMGIPTKIMTGYVGEDQLYHSWIMVFIDGTWQTAAFSVSPNTWSRCDVTFASTGATQYTGDGGSYTDRYTY